MPQMLRCQTCSRSFLKTADLHEHVESFKARARDLTIELLQCLAHATSLTGGVLESARDEGNDFNIDSHDDIGGIDDDDENKEEDSVGFGSDRSDDKDGDDEDGNGFEIDENNRYTAGERPKIPCPRIDCDTMFPSWTRLERHYQTHVRCHEVCFLCKRTFDRVSLFVDHKCKKLEGSDRVRILGRRRALRILASQDMKRFVAEQERTIADVQTGLSPPRKRSKTQTHNSVIRSPSGILVTESDDTNDPMVEAGIIVQQSQEIPQQLTNPGELIDAGTVHLPISGIPTDAMVMHQGFITPPGPSRGSIFGSQNVGYPFVEESHSEARGALFYASRLSGSWSHTDYQFPDGSLPTMALEPQGNDILATEEMMTCDGTIVRGVAANVYK